MYGRVQDHLADRIAFALDKFHKGRRLGAI